MKNKIIALLSLAACLVTGCTPKDSVVDEPIDQTGISIWPLHSRGKGYVGDPMPYYENGKMYVFYLEDARNYGWGGFHPISLLETTDLLHYEDKGIMLNFVDNRYSIEFALATGSVIKDKTGLYHYFYGGYNDNLNFTGQPYAQTILHATSPDLYNWTKDPNFNNVGYIIGNSNDFRDPYVLYMEDVDEYWMLVTSRTGGVSTVLKYTSKDLLNWTNGGSFFRDNRFNNMECSSLIRWKGYWYYSFSENGTHGYTKFFAKRNLSDAEWIECPSLEGFFAGRPVLIDNDRLLIFGWAPTKGLYDSTNPDWAGNLIVTELKQDMYAFPRSVMPQEFKDAFDYKYEFNLLSTGKPTTSVSLAKQSGIQSKTFENFEYKKMTRASFDLTINGFTGKCGISFGTNSDNKLGAIAFTLDATTNQFLFYNNVSNNKYNSAEYFVTCSVNRSSNHKIELITYDTVTAVYVDNEVSLIMRTSAIQRNNWCLFSDNMAVTFDNISFYK